ncbi:unnamed protein product [Adineta steineri]|uniref:Arrestin C-terminal-like domain-containing protein n=1 Tax=Adineta steineri TaxID=433720 RepID=A0A819XHT0_9BILA|nr:unnamed protein product [Adineta steineri]CAF4141667.1 unnamed protein product [Adineta steineri]
MKNHSRYCRYFLLILILLNKNLVTSESNIECRFDEQDDNIFWIGETITGFVDFVNKDNTDLKLARIDGELIGEVVALVRVETESDEVEKEEEVKEIIFNQKILVHPHHTNGSFPVRRGKQSWPFRFQLTEDLPPSFEQKKIDIHRFNIHKICLIVVKQPGRLLSLTTLKTEKTSRNGVRLRVTFEKNVVIAGNNVSFNVDLINPKGALIRHVSIVLTQYVDCNFREKTFNIIKQDLDYIKSLKHKSINRNFQIPIPSTTPVTFKFDNSITNHYKLHFEVHLRGIFTIIKLEFPIIVMDLIPETNDNEDDQ